VSSRMKFTDVALSDCCEIISGSTPSRLKSEYWNGDINWFTPKDLSGIKSKYVAESPEKITQLGIDSCSAKLLPPQSLLLSSRAPIGHLAVSTLEACTNQGFKSLLPNDNVDVEYLFYAIKKIVPQLQDLGNGATFKEISKATLSRVKIPLPPLPEQKKIASILDAADSLRQKDQQLIEKYTALSQSWFLELFGDPVSNPMGWDKKRLKEVGVIYTGNTPSRENLQYYGNDIEWIKTNNINTPNMYLTSAVEHLSEAGLKVGRSVESGSLLVTCIAGSKSVIGNVAIADRKVAFNQQINSFTPFNGNVLFFYSLFIAGKKHIQSFSTNGMKGMINKSKFESIDFIIPPITLQNQFAERIQAIEAQKQQAQASLQKSEDLFNSLLQRAFKGELTQNDSQEDLL